MPTYCGEDKGKCWQWQWRKALGEDNSFVTSVSEPNGVDTLLDDLPLI